MVINHEDIIHIAHWPGCSRNFHSLDHPPCQIRILASCQPLLIFTYCSTESWSIKCVYTQCKCMTKCAFVCQRKIHIKQQRDRTKSAKVSFILLQLNRHFLSLSLARVHTQKTFIWRFSPYSTSFSSIERECNLFSFVCCCAKIWQSGGHITQQ